jgi:endonuclease V-like protein UPF0215 family
LRALGGAGKMAGELNLMYPLLATMRRLSHVVGFDDGPFPPDHRGDVPVVGTVYAGLRLDGVLSTRVRRDGTNATRVLVRVVSQCRFAGHLQLVMLQGIAFAGFNVVDLHELHRSLGLPVLVVARRDPNLESIRRALLTRIPGGARKWSLIERAGPMEEVGRVFVQRAGLTPEEARAVVERLALHSVLPEPLRAAHLIAAAMVLGESRGRP